MRTDKYFPPDDGRCDTHSTCTDPTTPSTAASMVALKSSPPVPIAVNVRCPGYLLTCGAPHGSRHSKVQVCDACHPSDDTESFTIMLFSCCALCATPVNCNALPSTHQRSPCKRSAFSANIICWSCVYMCAYAAQAHSLGNCCDYNPRCPQCEP
jgi:hypothetical protein